ncbi:MAG TPA: type IX secretion system membrane protein PorP/SprF [Saprospiraceae bacterium]
MGITKKIFSALCVFFLVCICAKNSYSQQYPVFTQYYFNELVINPAFAGAHVQLSLTSTYRNQWVNFPGAPRTISVSGHTALYNGKMGLGLLVNHDEIGSYGNQNVYGYYSYKIHFRDATLSMGLQAGFNFIGVDFSKLDLQDPNDPSFIPINEFKPNFGTGVYYNRKNFFVGFSIPFILNSDLSSDIETSVANIQEARYYFLRGGSIFPINPKETVKLNPSFLVRAQEGQPLSMDLNLGIVIHDVLSTGVSWRSGDALMQFIDLKLSEKFHFAYSYDWTSSDINKFSNGSHEFMLNYRAKITTIHKELNCPTYYHYR